MDKRTGFSGRTTGKGGTTLPQGLSGRLDVGSELLLYEAYYLIAGRPPKQSLYRLGDSPLWNTSKSHVELGRSRLDGRSNGGTLLVLRCAQRTSGAIKWGSITLIVRAAQGCEVIKGNRASASVDHEAR